MTRLVIDVDAPKVTKTLRTAASALDDPWATRLLGLADAIEAAADKRYVVLDADELGDADFKHAADVLAKAQFWVMPRVLDAIKAQMDALQVDPCVQRVLDVAAKEGIDIDHAQAQRIADALLPEGSEA